MNQYPRESVELVPLTVTVDGVAATGYTTALVTENARPTTWVAAVTVGTDTGLMLPGGATAPGNYRIFVKVVSAPETPILDLGLIKLT